MILETILKKNLKADKSHLLRKPPTVILLHNLKKL